MSKRFLKENAFNDVSEATEYWYNELTKLNERTEYDTSQLVRQRKQIDKMLTKLTKKKSKVQMKVDNSVTRQQIKQITPGNIEEVLDELEEAAGEDVGPVEEPQETLDFTACLIALVERNAYLEAKDKLTEKTKAERKAQKENKQPGERLPPIPDPTEEEILALTRELAAAKYTELGIEPPHKESTVPDGETHAAEAEETAG